MTIRVDAKLAPDSKIISLWVKRTADGEPAIVWADSKMLWWRANGIINMSKYTACLLCEVGFHETQASQEDSQA